MQARCNCGATFTVASFDGRTLCPRCVDALRALAVGVFDVDTLARTYRLSESQVNTLRGIVAHMGTVTFA